jgi:ABC-type glycerol-3-phosphate transport system substrate-binding protein
MAKYRLYVTMASLLGAAALVLSACGTDSQSGGGGGGGAKDSTASIQIWEGWTGTEAKTFTKLVNQYEKQNPGEKISSLYVDNDDTLQKVTTAGRGELERLLRR